MPVWVEGDAPATVRSATTGTPLRLRTTAEWVTPAGTRASWSEITVDTSLGPTVRVNGVALP